MELKTRRDLNSTSRSDQRWTTVDVRGATATITRAVPATARAV